MFVDRTFLLWVVLSLVIPFAIGGWTGLLWGGLVRMFLVHHVTWSVNSVCHTFGERAYQTTIAAATSGWSVCWPWARAGTTTTTRSHARPSTAWIAGSSTLGVADRRLGAAAAGRDVQRIAPERLAPQADRAFVSQRLTSEAALGVRLEGRTPRAYGLTPFSSQAREAAPARASPTPP